MRPFQVRAHAKINLSLGIRSRMPDGFHSLDMLLTSVEIADVICFTPFSGIAVFMDGKPSGRANTAYRTIEALQKRGLIAGGIVHIDKQIPFMAGMGGSSADAAGLLYAMQSLGVLDRKAAFEIAKQVGSDVRFMMQGGAARVTGKGDCIESLRYRPFWVLIAKPAGAGVSTARAFADFDAIGSERSAQNEKLIEAIAGGKDFSAYMVNELERAAALQNPDIVQLIKRFQQWTPYAAMTGSGSAVIGLFEQEEDCKKAYAHLDVRQKWVTRTAPEGCVLLSV